jgi:GTPase SAR1 family protein
VFDIRRVKTFEKVIRWIDDLEWNLFEYVPCVLVGNKTDLGQWKIEYNTIKIGNTSHWVLGERKVPEEMIQV